MSKPSIKIISYSVETIKPSKRVGIWMHCQPNILRPAAYLQRPSWVSDAQWAVILKSIRLEIEPEALDLPE